MFTIKTLNAISPVGLAKLNKNLFDVSVVAEPLKDDAQRCAPDEKGGET